MEANHFRLPEWFRGDNGANQMTFTAMESDMVIAEIEAILLGLAFSAWTPELGAWRYWQANAHLMI